MTVAQFRRMALGLPRVVESSHMGHPDFRVDGRIFATLAQPGNGIGMVKLLPEQQKIFLDEAPAAFSPASGAWGRNGATMVMLRDAPISLVRDALELAWSAITGRLSK